MITSLLPLSSVGTLEPTFYMVLCTLELVLHGSWGRELRSSSATVRAPQPLRFLLKISFPYLPLSISVFIPGYRCYHGSCGRLQGTIDIPILHPASRNPILSGFHISENSHVGPSASTPPSFCLMLYSEAFAFCTLNYFLSFGPCYMINLHICFRAQDHVSF